MLPPPFVVAYSKSSAITTSALGTLPSSHLAPQAKQIVSFDELSFSAMTRVSWGNFRCNSRCGASSHAGT